MTINVLFVCLGNICRSPMAEAVFKDMAAKAGLSDQFQIASAGTDAYHTGEPAHPGTRRILAAHGIKSDNRARQVTRAELSQADYIVAMDQDNLSDLQYLARDLSLAGRLDRLLDFAPKATRRDVPDPYYTGDFEETYRLVEAGCRGLLEVIRQDKGI
jgi:protein-tyrosine phosphatase